MRVGRLNHAAKMGRNCAGQKEAKGLRKLSVRLLGAGPRRCESRAAEKKHGRKRKRSAELQVFIIDAVRLAGKGVTLELELAPERGQLGRIAVTRAALEPCLASEAWHCASIWAHHYHDDQKSEAGHRCSERLKRLHVSSLQVGLRWASQSAPVQPGESLRPVSYTHLRAHETVL